MAAIMLSWTFFIVCLSSFSLGEAQNGGFSLELIHRDSPNSPLYDPSLTPSQRLANALRRSIVRANQFNRTSASPNSAEAEIIADAFEYLMKIFIGTPPVEILAIADTGSDLIWTQCKPCIHCYKQKAPLFDPNASSTYANIPCLSEQCRSLGETGCQSRQEANCVYEYDYGDGSFTFGNLAVDTVTLGSTTGGFVPLPNTFFGCGHNNRGSFDDNVSGVVGLGGGPFSLVSQMGSSIDGKFSYCLILVYSDSKITSKINFGRNALVSGHGVVSTPIVPQSPVTFYHLTLEAISVGDDQRLELGNYFVSGTSNGGNIIIDSGSALTQLPSEFYSAVESVVKKKIDLERVKSPVQDLSLCYKFKSGAVFPLITMHFTGADVKLNNDNTFLRVTQEVICFAFAPSDIISIFGNLAQMNFLIGYDLQKMTVL